MPPSFFLNVHITFFESSLYCVPVLLLISCSYKNNLSKKVYVKNEAYHFASVTCLSVDRSILPTSLHDWMFCVSLLLPGSENRRNKLQGMMSDFPPKPTPPPSVSGQARSGEGKTSPLNMLYRKP